MPVRIERPTIQNVILENTYRPDNYNISIRSHNKSYAISWGNNAPQFHADNTELVKFANAILEMVGE